MLGHHPSLPPLALALARGTMTRPHPPLSPPTLALAWGAIPRDHHPPLPPLTLPCVWGYHHTRPPPTSAALALALAWGYHDARLNPTPGTLVLAIVWGCIPQCIACALYQLFLIVSICYVDLCCSLVVFEKIIYDMHECVNHIKKNTLWSKLYLLLLLCA